MGVLMLAAGVGAIVARPTVKLADLRHDISLEEMIPGRFGDWSQPPMSRVRVVNPQEQEMLDRMYSQTVTRTYVNSKGYGIMLSVVYGSDQRDRGSLAAHKPEVCYPAQGFVVQDGADGQVPTPAGDIPVRRLYAVMDIRHEPLTYWFTVGDTVTRGRLHKRLIDLRYGFTGRIPDGLLFRVSSIDQDRTRAYAMQDQFINDLLGALSPAERQRLSGLGGP
jgi:EpsI family protein